MHTKERKNNIYSTKFKVLVIEAMSNEHLELFETIVRFRISNNSHNAKHMICNWEQIYL